MQQVTTQIQIRSAEDPTIHGEEKYRIVGNLLSNEQLTQILQACKGLKRNWNCIEKAIVVQEYLGKGIVELGSMQIWNKERTGSFGYYFNPPLEFHAWVRVSGGIIDVALPGTIEAGLKVKDEKGWFLDRDLEPIVLAGAPPEWLEYIAQEYIF